jgi:anti-sigma factor RsiW
MANDSINTTNSDNMVCSEIEQLVDLHIDGELDEKIKCLVDKHLESCESCAAVYSQTSELVELAKTLKNIPIPEGVRVRLRTALHQQLGYPTLHSKL